MTFTWWGTELEPFDHVYNTTLSNERAVEIAVAKAWLHGRALGSGVEIGNVLSHYGVPAHRCIDRYETAAGVDNIDVFDLDGSFDWIVAISTLEHVGHDEHPRDDHASQRAIEHLRSLLAPHGAMLVTIPGGYHKTLDDHLAGGAGATRCATLVRTLGGWVQTPEPRFLTYGPHARSVWIGEWNL